VVLEHIQKLLEELARDVVLEDELVVCSVENELEAVVN